eukprot:CAMPEP_0172696848 /NCGR_PEP_ID=MMETSP1074-20121228/28344_1 /TAXON_ID=2916 /ORGANISM="Ceratium fusus, Strain PA161109" /LENGTH=100 /DNA_ID=CAMNT_0013517657 /DNA_START=102 /DNA_END=404 /DNA_ORIENTATION=+
MAHDPGTVSVAPALPLALWAGCATLGLMPSAGDQLLRATFGSSCLKSIGQAIDLWEALWRLIGKMKPRSLLTRCQDVVLSSAVLHAQPPSDAANPKHLVG